MIDLIKITPNGDITLHQWATGNTLEQLQEYVGGYIEVHHLRIGKRTFEIYINEDGKSMNLPLNEAFTLLFNLKMQQTASGVAMVQDTLFFDLILGNVVLALNPDPSEDA